MRINKSRFWGEIWTSIPSCHGCVPKSAYKILTKIWSETMAFSRQLRNFPQKIYYVITNMYEIFRCCYGDVVYHKHRPNFFKNIAGVEKLLQKYLYCKFTEVFETYWNTSCVSLNYCVSRFEVTLVFLLFKNFKPC